jgi:hypothetical protein
MILASFDHIYAAENLPSMEQTGSFIASALIGKHTLSSDCDNSNSEHKEYKEKNYFSKAELILLRSNRNCIGKITIKFSEINRITLTTSSIGSDQIYMFITCDKVNTQKLGSYKTPQCVYRSLERFMLDAPPKRKILEDASTNSEEGANLTDEDLKLLFNIDIPDYSYEWKWMKRYEFYENSGSFKMGKNSNENIKLSKRTFNAMKHYASFYDFEIKFTDYTSFKIDGSEFD